MPKLNPIYSIYKDLSIGVSVNKNWYVRCYWRLGQKNYIKTTNVPYRGTPEDRVEAEKVAKKIYEDFYRRVSSGLPPPFYERPVIQKRLRKVNTGLYVAIVCYHCFDAGRPMYSFKIGLSVSPDIRMSDQGLIPYKSFYSHDYGNKDLGVWEQAYKVALGDVIGINKGARYGGAGATECFGVFETLEEVKEYLQDLIKEMDVQLRNETEVRIPLAA